MSTCSNCRSVKLNTRIEFVDECDLTYMYSTESPQMDMAALLASIGGNLGLFLGVSVDSLCELSGIAFGIILI